MELNKVYNEDCLIGMGRIADKSVDMILCDLPYGTTACKWDVIIPFAPLWEQYERIIKDNGAIVLTASQPFTSILVNSNIKMFRHEWIWLKETGTNFANIKYAPFKQHESVLVFSKRQAKYFPIMEKKTNSTLSREKYDFNPDCKTEVYRIKRSSIPANSRSQVRFPSTVQRFVRDKGLHPTQKPVALFEYLIKTYTNEGETVLDNCMGSGTTAIACINTNRNYIGFEKEEKYYQIIQDRIKKHTPQLKLIA